MDVRNRLRERREQFGLTQRQLAERAGVTRQTVGGIESERYGPGLEIALRLSRALSCRVEDLFELESSPVTATAGVHKPDVLPCRVALAEIAGQRIARPLQGLGSFRWSTTAAHGLAHCDRDSGAVLVRELPHSGRGLFLAGCDPALGLLSAHVSRGAGRVEAMWWNAGNAEAAAQLRRREAHAVSVHGADGASGPDVGFPIARFRIARWQMGWIAARGNPHRIEGPEDLMRPGVRLVNRETGSGARSLLDALLARLGISPDCLTGYERLVRSHSDVADAVALGAADVGIGIEAAAVARDLAFVPLRAEVSDLLVPVGFLDDPVVDALLETLRSAAFRTDLAAFGPYDTGETGDRIA